MKKVVKALVAIALVAGCVAFAPKVKIEIVEAEAAACPAGVVNC